MLFFLQFISKVNQKHKTKYHYNNLCANRCLKKALFIIPCASKLLRYHSLNTNINTKMYLEKATTNYTKVSHYNRNQFTLFVNETLSGSKHA